jgi:hypothetical protein
VKPGSFSTPEMKVRLLVAVMLERDRAPPNFKDWQLLKRIKKRGAYSKWELPTLRVELSRARRWVESKDGQNWIAHEVPRAQAWLRAVEAMEAAAEVKEKVPDQVDGGKDPEFARS